MASLFYIYKRYGAALASTALITSETYIGSKNANVYHTAMAVGIPTGSDPPNYSYELFVQPKCIIAPLNLVSNWRMWYKYTRPETGVILYGGSTGKAYANTPTDNVSDIAIYDMSQYGAFDDPVSIKGQATAVNSVIGYMVFQLAVDTTASFAASHDPMLIHYAYSEE